MGLVAGEDRSLQPTPSRRTAFGIYTCLLSGGSFRKIFRKIHAPRKNGFLENLVENAVSARVSEVENTASLSLQVRLLHAGALACLPLSTCLCLALFPVGVGLWLRGAASGELVGDDGTVWCEVEALVGSGGRGEWGCWIVGGLAHRAQRF